MREAVEEYLKTNPGATSTVIAEALNKKGIKITVNYAANIKTTLNKLGRGKKAAKAEPAAAVATHEAEPIKTNGTLTVQHVKAVAETVKTIGGFGQAKEMLGVIRDVGGLKKFRDLLDAMEIVQ
jgi:hypothetical protein